MKYLTFILLLTLLTTSCQKELIIDNDDYLTFGTFHGECLGNDCIKLFILEEDKLFEDPNDFNDTEIGTIALSNAKFNLVKDLINYFPTDLFDEENQTFGCPDCRDQGGIYVQYVIDGNIGEFRINTDKNETPTFLHEFIDKVNEKLELL